MNKQILPLHLALLLTCTLLSTAFPVRAQAPSDYEGWPTLKASEVLKPGYLRGPYHTVYEPVPTRGFANQYTLQTSWGTDTVWGNDLLLKRIHECYAIARLEHASKSEEFTNSLGKAAAKPFIAVGNTLKDPIGAVENVGKGALRFIQRAGEAVERGGERGRNTDGAAKALLGFSKQKREIAYQLGVDPYTDNPILQKRLDDMARAAFAGGFVIRAGTFALSAGADVGLATVAGALSMGKNVAEALRDHSPVDLSGMNRATLLKLGVSEATTKAFLRNASISPTSQTIITSYLNEMNGVPGLEDFLKMTLSCKSTPDVRFFLRCVEMMTVYHTKVAPVRRILNLNGLPAIHARDNSLVLPLGVDYASWNSHSDKLTAAVAAYKPDVEISRRMIYLSGEVSPLARKKFEARGFVVSDRANPAVYK